MKISIQILLIFSNIWCTTKNKNYSKELINNTLFKIYSKVIDAMNDVTLSNDVLKYYKDISEESLRKRSSGCDKYYRLSSHNGQEFLDSKKIPGDDQSYDKLLMEIGNSKKISFSQFKGLTLEDQSSCVVKALSQKIKNKIGDFKNSIVNFFNRSKKTYENELAKFNKCQSQIKKDLSSLLELVNKYFSKEQIHISDSENKQQNKNNSIEFKTCRKKWVIDPEEFRKNFKIIGEKTNKNENTTEISSRRNSISSMHRKQKSNLSFLEETKSKIGKCFCKSKEAEKKMDRKDIEKIVESIENSINSLSFTFRNIEPPDSFKSKEEEYIRTISCLEESLKVLKTENEKYSEDLKNLTEQLNHQEEQFQQINIEYLNNLELHKKRLDQNYKLEMSNQKIIENLFLLVEEIFELIEHNVIRTDTFKNYKRTLIEKISDGLTEIASCENGLLYSELIERYIAKISQIFSLEPMTQKEIIHVEEEDVVNDYVMVEEGQRNRNERTKRELYTIAEEFEPEYEI